MGKAARKARRESGEVKPPKVPTRAYRTRAQEQESRRSARDAKRLIDEMMPSLVAQATSKMGVRW